MGRTSNRPEAKLANRKARNRTLQSVAMAVVIMFSAASPVVGDDKSNLPGVPAPEWFDDGDSHRRASRSLDQFDVNSLSAFSAEEIVQIVSRWGEQGGHDWSHWKSSRGGGEPGQISCEVAIADPSSSNQGTFEHAGDLSGDVMAIGGYGNSFGEVYVYRMNGVLPQFERTLKSLLPSGSLQVFGRNLAIAMSSEDVIFIGDPSNDDRGQNAGAVHVVRYDGNDWEYDTTIYSPNPVPGSGFGAGLCADESTLAISPWVDTLNLGRGGGDGNGSPITIFRVAGGTLTYEDTIAELAGPGSATSPTQTHAMDVDGNLLILAAEYLDANESQCTSRLTFVRVYRRQPSGDWTLDFSRDVRTIGTPVAISGDTFVFQTTKTAREDCPVPLPTMAVFSYRNGSWRQEGEIVRPGSGQSFNYNFSSAAIEGGLLLLGVEMLPSGFGEFRDSRMYVFRRHCPCSWEYVDFIYGYPGFGSDKDVGGWIALDNGRAITGSQRFRGSEFDGPDRLSIVCIEPVPSPAPFSRAWTGNQSGDGSYDGFFNDNQNWVPSGVPGSSTGALFSLAQNYTVYMSTDVESCDLSVSTGNVVLQTNGGNARNYDVGCATVPGGTLTLQSVNLEADLFRIQPPFAQTSSVIVGSNSNLHGRVLNEIGGLGVGTLHITNGGTALFETGLRIGRASYDVPGLEDENGILLIDGGAQVQSNGIVELAHGTGIDAARGRLTVSGAGSRFEQLEDTDRIYVGGTNSGVPVGGIVEALNGATIVGRVTTVLGNGELRIDGGTFESLGTLLATSGTLEMLGGILEIDFFGGMVVDGDCDVRLALSTIIPVGDEPIDVDPIDIDDDMKSFADLVISNRGLPSNGGDSITILRGNGDGTFNPVPITIGGLHDPTQLVAADFNNDTLADIACVNFTDDGSLGIIVNQGAGSFAPAVNIPVGSFPRSITAVDLDQDAGFDIDLAIVVNDPDTDEPFVQTIRNDTNQGQQLTFVLDDRVAEGQSPLLVTSGDVDQDLDDDLITINGSDGLLRGPLPSTVSIVPNLLNQKQTCAGDLTGTQGGGPDGQVNVFDLFVLLSNWNTNGIGANLAPPLDTVDVFDLFVLLGQWGDCLRN